MASADTGKTDAPADAGLRDRLISAMLISLMRLLGMFPYRLRVPLMGWVVSNIFGPVIGYRRRVRANLAQILPDMPADEVARLSRAVPAQVGRTLAELFSPDDLIKVAANTPMTGNGVAALDAAKEAGRPVILVSGHIGNYDIGRSSFIQRGHTVGALYRSMNYRGFNEFYVSRISRVGTPLFPRGRRGLAEMIRFLKGGNTLALLIDQHMTAGAPLKFFGHTAWTALSAAEMALRYDAVLLPFYAIRQADGLSFEVIVEAPVAHTTPEEMTQTLNDSLEAQVRAHMDQWLWVHRRWKSQ